MKFSTTLLLISGMVLISANSFGQLPKVKIEKPKVNIDVPKIEKGSGSNDINIPGRKDASGLFSNITDDPSADVHRKNAVKNLETMEVEYSKTAVDYEMLTKLMFENERTLGHILKLEPNINRSRYDERYLSLKERADKENAAYAEATKLEQQFEQDFNAPKDLKKPDPLTFRTDTYSAHHQCYCRNYSSETKTLQEFNDAKKQYETYTSQLVGYSNESTQTIFANMETCIQNGNAYAVWASTENLDKAVVAYNTENKASKPKRVIQRCDEYLAALERIETDNSILLDEKSKSAISKAKVSVQTIKTEAETYISSGEYQKYLDKVHAEEIAKVFMPAAAMKNATLENGAMNYVKGAEYNDYLKNNSGDSEVASTFRAVCVSKVPYVKKNEYGIPLYEYHEIWVAYKGKDGKCYLTAVYASYTYKGGGTYETTPIWGADAPDEMACENVSK